MKCASTSTIIQVNMQNTTSTFNLDHIGIKGEQSSYFFYYSRDVTSVRTQIGVRA